MKPLQLSHDIANAAVFLLCICSLFYLEPFFTWLGGAL